MKKLSLRGKVLRGILGATILITPMITISAVACFSDTKLINKPNIIFNTKPVNQTVFLNQNKNLPTLSIQATVDNQNVQLAYQWYESDSNSTTNGKAIAGATQSTYTISPSDTQKIGKKYFYVDVIALNNETILISKTSEIYTVKINQLPTINIITQPEDQFAIMNQNKDLPTFSVGVNNIEDTQLFYQWYSNTVDSNANGNVITGANQAEYTVSADQLKATGKKYFYVKISGTFKGTELNPITSNTATLTINALPKITISSQPQDFESFLNQKNDLPVLSIGVNNIDGGQLKYQWYSTMDTGSNAKWNLINGENNSTYKIQSHDTSKIGSKYFYVKISGTFNGTKLASVNSTVATLTINALPKIIISSQPQDVEVLVGQLFNMPHFSVATNNLNGAKLSYQWYSSSTNSHIDGTATGANFSQYQVTYSDTKKVGEKYYYVKVTGTLNGFPLTPVISNVAKLTIHALPDVVIVKEPERYNVVSINQTTNLPTLSVSVKNIKGAQWSYQWYKNDILIRGATNSSYSIPFSDVKIPGKIRYYAWVYADINFVGLTPVNTITSTIVVRA